MAATRELSNNVAVAFPGAEINNLSSLERERCGRKVLSYSLERR
jgi:hypothetical protein